MKRSHRIKPVVFILSLTFLFQSILLANPDIQTAQFNLHILQVPAISQSINSNAIHAALESAVYEQFAARGWNVWSQDFRYRLSKTMDVKGLGRVEVEMDFEGRSQDNSKIITIDCIANSKKYKAIVNTSAREVSVVPDNTKQDSGADRRTKTKRANGYTKAEKIEFTPPSIDIKYFDRLRPERSFILAVNPGSTSTKVGIGQVINGRLVMFETEVYVKYPSEGLDLEQKSAVMADAVQRYLAKNNIPLRSLAAVCGRGGIMRPNKGGLTSVNHKKGDRWVTDKTIIADLLNSDLEHPSNMGAIVADIIAEKQKIPAFTLDPVVTDNLAREATLGGKRPFRRRSIYHALNIHAVVRILAGQLLKKSGNAKPKQLNIAACHVGGGNSVAAAMYETASGEVRAVNVNNALLGEGPFSSERGTPQAGELIRWIYDNSDKPLDELRREFTKKAGLVSYTGTNSIEDLGELIARGRDIKSDLSRRTGGNFEFDRGIIEELTNASAERFEKLFPAAVNDLKAKLASKNIDILEADLETLFKTEVADLALRGMALQTARALP